MIRLTREIRMALKPPSEQPITNSWSGWPSTLEVVPQLAIRCTVSGEPDTRSGYVCNIKLLDRLIRDAVMADVLPQLEQTVAAENLLSMIEVSCQKRWQEKHPIVNLEMLLSPWLKVSTDENDPSKRPNSMATVTQQFEFSAAHRLHNDQLSDQQNRELFGKCNNPSGHGHNYVVEISVANEPDAAGFDLQQFERTVKQHVIERLDHKHLNLDIEYFQSVNPTVENIAIAIWNWLDGNLDSGNLANVRLYETPKTWADYSG